MKDKVYISPLPANVYVMKDQKTAAITAVDSNMLRRVWKEFSYRLDVRCAAGSDHI